MYKVKTLTENFQQNFFNSTEKTNYNLPQVFKTGGQLVKKDKEGSKIHIKEKNKGKFKAAASNHNMSVQQYVSKVLSDPSAPTYLKKRAVFAKNASKWHKYGGSLKMQQGGLITSDYQRLNIDSKKRQLDLQDNYVPKLPQTLNISESPQQVMDRVYADDNINYSNTINKLDSAVNKWSGIKYSFGGKNSTGIDCSGFTKNVFQELGINIPHGTIRQYQESQKINKEDIKPGDLLFLKGTQNRTGPTHVGIALSGLKPDGTVDVAASQKSNGSTVYNWDLNKGYYAKHWLGAGRI